MGGWRQLNLARIGLDGCESMGQHSSRPKLTSSPAVRVNYLDSIQRSVVLPQPKEASGKATTDESWAGQYEAVSGLT